jgi:hypothetical protein
MAVECQLTFISQARFPSINPKYYIFCSALFIFHTSTFSYTNAYNRLSSLPSTTCLVVKLLPFRLLSKNVKVRIYNTMNLPVVLYGCETRSLTLRK